MLDVEIDRHKGRLDHVQSFSPLHKPPHRLDMYGRNIQASQIERVMCTSVKHLYIHVTRMN